MRFNKIYLFIVLQFSFLHAEIGVTLIGGFNHSNVIHQKKQLQEWSGDIKSLSFSIERKLGPLKTSIGYLNGGYINSINNISQEITSNIIEKMSGDKLNESSVKAAVEDISKKNIGKYL